MENNSESEPSNDRGKGSDSPSAFSDAGGIAGHINKCETLEEGTSAFVHWLNSEDKKSLAGENPIVLLKFLNDIHTILYDTHLQKQLEVEVKNGVPFCTYCQEDDCAHVGFAIEVEQLFGHRPAGETEQKMEDLIEI